MTLNLSQVSHTITVETPMWLRYFDSLTPQVCSTRRTKMQIKWQLKLATEDKNNFEPLLQYQVTWAKGKNMKSWQQIAQQILHQQLFEANPPPPKKTNLMFIPE